MRLLCQTWTLRIQKRNEIEGSDPLRNTTVVHMCDVPISDPNWVAIPFFNVRIPSHSIGTLYNYDALSGPFAIRIDFNVQSVRASVKVGRLFPEGWSWQYEKSFSSNSQDHHSSALSDASSFHIGTMRSWLILKTKLEFPRREDNRSKIRVSSSTVYSEIHKPSDKLKTQVSLLAARNVYA